METARGSITEEELKEYGGANVRLFDGANDVPESGTITVGGSNTYEWTITWDPVEGFTNQTWEAWGTDYQAYTEEQLRTEIDTWGFYIADSLSGNRDLVTRGCVTMIRS